MMEFDNIGVFQRPENLELSILQDNGNIINNDEQ